MTGFLWMLGVLALLFAAGATAEVVARWWVRRRSHDYVFPPGLRLELHLDRDVLPELEPVVRFEVNGDGERGDEVPRSNEGLYRVLVAGGSQPEGYLLDQNSCWPGALHRKLERPDRVTALGASTVHVGSIARSGVGSEALDGIFQRVLPRYRRLSAIIILVGASDVLQWLEQGAPSSGGAAVRVADFFRCRSDAAFGWKPTQLALLELAGRMRRRWLRPVHVHERAGRWVGKARAMRARAKVIRTAMPDPTAMLDRFGLHLRRAVRRAQEHADRVLVVRQSWFDRDPTPAELAHMWHGGVGQAWHEDVTTYYSVDVISRLMTLLDRRAARVAQACRAEQLDLRSILEPSLTTYYDSFHLTPAGASAVAEAVAAALTREPMVSADFSATRGLRCADLRAS